ncbi:MAG: preprotein translocase subunit SecY [Flavobacteriales bacterium]|jgi:preprotein translocase subunit SecY|tara:strand:+ start:7732 stop:9039 length:1308 start_codon:yes stop_codon:yes gene_type:complete
MKNLIDTLKNIWKIEELRNRILTTLGFLLIYRLGSFVALPGIDPQQLGALQNQTSDGLLGLLNMFTGGAFSQASIMALGIMPYISASIVIQLATMAVPYLQKLQKDGESGRTKISQITRYLTVLITCFQAPGYIANLKATLPAEAFLLSSGSFWFSSIIILVTGTMFAMWLGEKITDSGIGNGISLLIMVGIIASLPQAFLFEVGRAKPLIILVELVIMLIVILASVLLVQGVRRIPIQYAKRGATAQIAAARQYLPLKVNASGVMPIIFAQAIMFIPITFAGLSDSDGVQNFVATFSDFSGFWYNFVFAILIIVFTYLYTAITVNTNQMADDLKRNGGFVPGVKPGKDTAGFLDSVMSRIVLPGSVFLALLAILPAFAMNAGVNQSFAQFFGGTSLLIMVGVVLDTLQQIEGYLLNRHYDGLMQSGRLTGRSGM